MSTITIFLIGAPSSGKTVMAARLYAHLLMLGKRVIHIPETVSLLIRQGKINSAPDVPQKKILHSLLTMKDNYNKTGLTDFIISEDNPLATRLYSPDLYDEPSWRATFSNFKSCFYVKIELDISSDEYDATTRIHSFKESLELNETIDILMDQYGLSYFNANRKTSPEDILHYVQTTKQS